jgi:hypothetical protein
VDHLGRVGKFRAHFTDPVAQADHVVEALPGEPAHVLGLTAGDIDAMLAHHCDRVRMHGLGVAAGAGCCHRRARQPLHDRLGHL